MGVGNRHSCLFVLALLTSAFAIILSSLKPLLSPGPWHSHRYGLCSGSAPLWGLSSSQSALWGLEVCVGHQGDQHWGIPSSEASSLPPWLHPQWDPGQSSPVLNAFQHWSTFFKKWGKMWKWEWNIAALQLRCPVLYSCVKTVEQKIALWKRCRAGFAA